MLRIVTTVEVNMGFNLFTRANKIINNVTYKTTSVKITQEVVCDTQELKSVIKKWTEHNGWKISAFVDFLRAVRIQTPVELKELDKESKSFKCTTALGSEFILSLRRNHPSELHITQTLDNHDKLTKIYHTNCKSKANSIPTVNLFVRSIVRGNRKLDSYYNAYVCHRTLVLDNSHLLKVEVSEPNNKLCDDKEIRVLRNHKKIEDYLLSLEVSNNSFTVSEVFDKILELLKFTNEDISLSKRILVSYIELVGKSEIERSKVLREYGQLQEFAVLEDNKTFKVCNNGNWHYISPSVTIRFDKQKHHHVIICTDIDALSNIHETISAVTKRIKKLMKNVQ